MDERTEALFSAIAGAVLPLLDALETLRLAGRHFHPPMLPRLVEAVGGADAPLRAGLPAFRAAPWPSGLDAFRAAVDTAAELACRAFELLREAAAEGADPFGARRALRLLPDALEALYPAAAVSPPVSLFFIEEAARGDEALVARIEAAEAGPDTGLAHVGNERRERGGFSLYVPETYDPAAAHPLIVALHGGRGHGRAFLWSWLREARTRGAILLAPTAIGDTWSLAGPDVDSPNLARMVGRVRERWNVDAGRILLTGMSDGGTYSWLAGLSGDLPATHVAPFSASFHPMLLSFVDDARLEGLPVYLVHGRLDWMFPVDVAREAATALTARGADVTYREIPDLSHTYAVDENSPLMDWFLRT